MEFKTKTVHLHYNRAQDLTEMFCVFSLLFRLFCCSEQQVERTKNKQKQTKKKKTLDIQKETLVYS